MERAEAKTPVDPETAYDDDSVHMERAEAKFWI